MYRTKKAVIVNGQQLQSSEGDPYVAFRAHRARMQTRRNRKSEEQNYEKMIKLRRDFDQLRQLCLWTRQRELAKQELQDVNYKVGALILPSPTSPLLHHKQQLMMMKTITMSKANEFQTVWWYLL